ncbi:hypothetical protein [Olivibacter jilunii]|uniref:hypothetical protein n=1 Tax=Olivibacter jilunii TaxID=985016 RepID=UPI0010323416|nr:hypothetical protein [Olivibacter jilunii]
MKNSNQSGPGSDDLKGLMNRENLKDFYKKQLPALLKTVFIEPINGTCRIFKGEGAGTYGNALLLIGTTMLLYFIGPYLLAGKYLREMLSFGALFKFALLAGIFVLLVSLLSFGIKTFNGKPAFKQELLTGALCGVGLILLLFILLLVRIFGNGLDMYDLMSPGGIIQRIGFLLILVLYIYLFMVNIFQQSLRASGTSDTIGWYISPIAILLAGYLTMKIAQSLLTPSTPF